MNKVSRLFACFLMMSALAISQTSTSGNTKAVGTVESVSGTSLTLKTDAGVEITITSQDGTRVLRSEPGQKSLKEATPIQFSEIQAGDRTASSGAASADGRSIAATTIVVMKRGDIASKQAKEQQDWHNGVGGLVSKVDAAGNAITVSTMVQLQKKDVTVHVTPGTVIRRYSPDSVKFDDAKKSTLAEIKPGDQLRARGTKNADGTEMTADEIVSGTFRNIAGTVQSVDKDKNQVTLMDLATKKPVTIAVGADSQMRKLPEMMAQHIAMRLKGGASASSAPGAAGTPPVGPPPTAGTSGNGHGWSGAGGPPNGGSARGGNGGDMLQMVLSRSPVVQLTDLQKGDAVMLVATEGSSNSAPTAITLLTGVEPILSASPKGSDASTILSPWNLGGGNGEAAAAQ